MNESWILLLNDRQNVMEATCFVNYDSEGGRGQTSLIDF